MKLTLLLALLLTACGGGTPDETPAPRSTVPCAQHCTGVKWSMT